MTELLYVRRVRVVVANCNGWEGLALPSPPHPCPRPWYNPRKQQTAGSGVERAEYTSNTRYDSYVYAMPLSSKRGQH